MATLRKVCRSDLDSSMLILIVLLSFKQGCNTFAQRALNVSIFPVQKHYGGEALGKKRHRVKKKLNASKCQCETCYLNKRSPDSPNRTPSVHKQQ